jgi:hypothetical protein
MTARRCVTTAAIGTPQTVRAALDIVGVDHRITTAPSALTTAAPNIIGNPIVPTNALGSGFATSPTPMSPATIPMTPRRVIGSSDNANAANTGVKIGLRLMIIAATPLVIYC